jgi:hypothetical protein
LPEWSKGAGLRSAAHSSARGFEPHRMQAKNMFLGVDHCHLPAPSHFRCVGCFDHCDERRMIPSLIRPLT